MFDLGPLLGQGVPLGLTPEQIAAGGATLILSVMVILFLRGEIITKKHHDEAIRRYEDALADKDDQIERSDADRDLWRDIAAEALNISEAIVGRK